jgi:hypothetical protein
VLLTASLVFARRIIRAGPDLALTPPPAPALQLTTSEA